MLEAVVRGETRLALILGEPGIGKSRLAEELHDWCARGDGAVARARCYAAQGQLAYAPIAEWLRAEPLRAACAQMPQSQLAELARVLPEILAENPGIQRPGPLTESWERHHLYEALTAAFARATEAPAPVDRRSCSGATPIPSNGCMLSSARMRRGGLWCSPRCARKRPAAAIRSPACLPSCSSPAGRSSFRCCRSMQRRLPRLRRR